ncbi:histidine kinase [uncultured Williamsia sp.]|uniref:sensor histidine kinase n=1 Tax=uncultured Williamsia sp. TaxID=259311 RepID=UPI0026058A1D|nr:histidine kinase [uncultured Williamsia sp.]
MTSVETATTGRHVRWWPGSRPTPDRSWAFTAVWLVFLAYPIVSLLRSGQDVASVVWGLVLIALFAITYVVAATHIMSWRDEQRRRAAVGYGLVLIVLAAAASPVLADGTVSFTPYLMGIAAFGFGGVLGPVLVGVVLVVGLVLPLIVPGWTLDSGTVLALVIVALVMVLMISARSAEQRREEAETRQREADERLAVIAERERVARDVHDILGHSLTVMTVKTELAGRLVDIDPERAKAELAELHALSRQALAEVRSTVGALRTPDLRTELASARTALSAAEIAVEIDGSVDDIASARRDLFAWVVRESVTNVVRHSGARGCRIGVAPDRVVVHDDGAGISEHAFGNGLRGLTERVEAAGARLSVVGDAGGTTVSAVFDG